MKSLNTTILALSGIAGLMLVSCEPTPVYVPVYVPVEQKKPAPKKVTPKPVPRPPVETAEGFRAVEKPSTYSQ